MYIMAQKTGKDGIGKGDKNISVDNYEDTVKACEDYIEYICKQNGYDPKDIVIVIASESGGGTMAAEVATRIIKDANGDYGFVLRVGQEDVSAYTDDQRVDLGIKRYEDFQSTCDEYGQPSEFVAITGNKPSSGDYYNIGKGSIDVATEIAKRVHNSESSEKADGTLFDYSDAGFDYLKGSPHSAGMKNAGDELFVGIQAIAAMVLE